MKPYKLHPTLCQANWKPFWEGLKQTKLIHDPATMDWLAYQRGYWDLAFFARYFFPHYCRYHFSAMHNDFFRSESDPAKRGRREAIAAPRANAKTTIKLLIKAIHAIVYEYESYILVIGHSSPEAQEKVRNILEELETNQQLIRVYGDLAPKRGQQSGQGRWGKKKFVTLNGVMVEAKSRGQDIRGIKHGANRPTLLICDDIESLDGVLSPEQRLKTRDWFWKDLMKVGQVDGSTNVTVIGTVLHQESLLSDLLLRSPGFQSRRYQSIVSYAHQQDLWDQWQKIYTNLSDTHRHDAAHAFFEANREAMLEGAAVLWPEGEPYEYLMRLRVDEGISSFQSEKMNDPFDPERQRFNMDQAKRFRINYQEDGKVLSLQHLDGSGRIVYPHQISRLIAFHDPVLGKKAGQVSEPDFAAIVVVAEDIHGYLYVIEAYIEKDSPSKQIEKAFEIFDKWAFSPLYLEENGSQELLELLYKEVNYKRTDPPIYVKGVHQHENKYHRISLLEPDITNGYLLFAENINPRLIEQLTLFPTSYDDGPDALQGAVAQLSRHPIRRRSIR